MGRGFILYSVMAIIMLTAATVFAVGQEPISEHLKLKTDRANILGSREIEDVVVENGRLVNKGKIKQYAYKTGRVVATTPEDAVVGIASKNGLLVQDEMIEKRTPTSKIFKTNNANKFIAEITTKQKYFKDTQGIWWDIDYATTTADAFQQQTASRWNIFENAMASSLTAYPDPGTGGPTGDVGRFKLDTSFSTAREGTDTPGNTSTQHNARDWFSSPNYMIEFMGMTFDTSFIGSDKQINSATLNLWHSNKGADGSWVVHVMKWSPSNYYNFQSSDTGIATFNNCSAGSACALDIASTTNSNITTGQYNAYSLDADGLSYINKTGITPLAVVGDHFYFNSAPANTDDITEIVSADTSGTSNDPKLMVVYTDPTAPVISNLQAIDIAENSAIITWDTDDLSDSRIRYGTSSGSYATTVYDGSLVASHSLSATGLGSGTRYYYVAVSTNADGYSATSSEQTFDTLVPLVFKVRKSINESLSNSTTLQNDDALALTLATSTIYTINGTIFASSTSNQPDLKISFNAPSGTDLDIGYWATEGTAIQSGELLSNQQTSSLISLPVDNATVIHVSGTIKTSGTAGPLRLNWAQNATRTVTTTVLRGSYLRAESI